MDSVLGMIGLALRGGRLEAGDASAAAACAGRRCRLLLTARDAAGNTVRRAGHMAEEGRCPLAALPYSKEELGGALGRAQCAVAAVTDLGIATAIAEKLAGVDEETYGPAADRLRAEAALAKRRKARPAAP